MLRAAAIFALLGGCIEIPPEPTRECNVNGDCNTASGEVCENGTCWGDPPSGELAFVISPPAERPDLVLREFPAQPIAANGRIATLLFAEPRRLTTRFETVCAPPIVCDKTMLRATVSITRPSTFAGGPGFKASVEAEVDTTGPRVSVLVPREDGAPFTMTVVPTPRGDDASAVDLARVIPPFRTQISNAGNAGAFTLGGLDLPTIEGTLLAPSGSGLSGYRVVALGRWDAGASPSEVSTVAYTGSDGAFRLTLSAGLVGNVEIVARPTATDATAPTLHLSNISTAKPDGHTLTQPMALGAPVTRVITLLQRDGSGATVPVAGARVRVSASTPTADGGTAELVTEATSDDSGNVTLKLLDGALAEQYRLDVIPPASATATAIYDQAFSLTTTELMLPTRVRLRGVVTDARGEKLSSVTVTARPALSFLWNLEPASQAFLSSIPVSTAISNDSGEFVVWVDAEIAGRPGSYDLAFDPGRTASSLVRAPTWVQSAISVPVDQQSMTVPDVRLPDAAFVHGDVRDPGGSTVQGAEVKVFRASSDNQVLCEATSNAPSPCPEVALLLGRAASTENGVVELILPRD